MAELDGDLETAQEFYREAQRAGGSSARVGLATRPNAEGIRLYSVANGSEAEVSSALEAATQARRRNPAPIRLKRRDGAPWLSLRQLLRRNRSLRHHRRSSDLQSQLASLC